MSVPCAYQLYLSESWCADAARRLAAGVPASVAFRTKWEIALEQIDRLIAEQLPLAPVVADAGYGAVTRWREELTARGVPHFVGIASDTTVWPPGQEPLPVPAWSGRGRPPRRLRRGPGHQPTTAWALAHALAPRAWKPVAWREGTRGRMASPFAAVRVRPAHRDEQRSDPRPAEWLLIEWPRGESEPTHYWLSTLAEQAELEELVRLAMFRWRIERDFQELKDELGLDHYEGRSWRGFHHHGALCIAAYAFLAAERARLPPALPSSAPLAYPRVSTRAVTPVRPERHVPASIASQRWRQIRALVRQRPFCPTCWHPHNASRFVTVRTNAVPD